MSDQSALHSLLEWLRRVPDVTVARVSGTPGYHDQGVFDTLSVLAGSSGVLIVAIKTLPEFIRSRRSNVKITIKVADEEITVDGNADDVIPLIERILGA